MTDQTFIDKLEDIHNKWHYRFMDIPEERTDRRASRMVSEAADDLAELIEALPQPCCDSCAVGGSCDKQDPTDALTSTETARPATESDAHADPGPWGTPDVANAPAALTDEPRFNPDLIASLRDFGDEWGPLGVALAAASLTDSEALVSRLATHDDLVRVGLAEEGKCGNTDSNVCDFPCDKPPHGDDEWHDSGRGHRWRVEPKTESTPRPKVDADEALAEVLYAHGTNKDPETFSGCSPLVRDYYLRTARLTRRHIESTPDDPTYRAAFEAGRQSLAECSECAEYDSILWKQGDLLKRTVNALKGDPPELTTWSHHDIPQLAAEARSRIEAQKVGIDAQMRRTEKAEAERDAARAELDALRERVQAAADGWQGAYDNRPETRAWMKVAADSVRDLLNNEGSQS